MKLNTLSSKLGSRTSKKRLGRGIGSGLGKTSGRGHKGQHSRSGGFHKIGFEGGQMPLQRRLPKRGFKTRKAQTYVVVNVNKIMKLGLTSVDKDVLVNAGILKSTNKDVKIIGVTSIEREIKFIGFKLSNNLKNLIESANGMVEV